MTLVVARMERGRIAIAADTRLTEHQSAIPLQSGTIKSCMLPGDICVSFSNSPALADLAFKSFVESYPNGTNFANVVSFFEKSSRKTGNDYMVAFDKNPRLIKIVDGKRIRSEAKTAWIGDQAAYERFREYEAKHRRGAEQGRAMNAVLFADEPAGSPASDLYSTMRHIVLDREIASAGGFVSLVSNRDNGFRFSVYSDMLFDWPKGASEEYLFQLTDPITLEVAEEQNVGYAIAQISPASVNVNLVAFYLLKGKKLFLFHGETNQYELAQRCHIESNVEARDIENALKGILNTQWLLMITSGAPVTSDRSLQGGGVKLGIFVHVNTLPKPASQ